MENLENSVNKPWIISYGSSEYDGSPIDTLTPMHAAQQTHKYKLGLFVTGIVGIAAALIDFILIVVLLAKGADKGISSGITAFSIIFVVTLLVDVVFTVNLNRYIKEKRWLILYIPCLVLMIMFSVPQIMTLIALVIPNIKIENLPNFSWANYINIVICIIFIIAESARMYLHRNDLDLKQEIYKALK